MMDTLNNTGIVAAISVVGIFIGVFLFGFNTAEKYYSVTGHNFREDLVKLRLMKLSLTEIKCPVCDSYEIFIDDPYPNYSEKRGLLLDFRCKKCNSTWDVVFRDSQVKQKYDGRIGKVCDYT